MEALKYITGRKLSDVGAKLLVNKSFVKGQQVKNVSSCTDLLVLVFKYVILWETYILYG